MGLKCDSNSLFVSIVELPDLIFLLTFFSVFVTFEMSSDTSMAIGSGFSWKIEKFSSLLLSL